MTHQHRTRAQREEAFHRACCYHEAAHAVFALKAVGGSVCYVEVNRDWDNPYAGNCRVEVFFGGGYADHWRNALFCMVGRLAEVRVGWRALQTWDEFIDELALENDPETLEIYKCLEAMASDQLSETGDPEDEYDAATADADQALDEMWPEITAVADALMERGYLDGGEVERMVAAAEADGEDA
jgi:hypothetical protein